MITREEYMKDSSKLFKEYYSQFVTESTKRFILTSLTKKKIKEAIESGDEHLNEIAIPFNHMGRGGGWWWDYAPINLQLAKELGEVGERSLPSQATCTCIGKAAARILAEEE